MGKINKLSIICMMLLSASIVSAQKSPISFGLKAGLNLSNTSLNVDPLDKKARIGFQVGLTVEYTLSDAFFLQSGLSFTTKGGEAKGSINIANLAEGNAKITLNQMYLQLPVMAAYKIDVTPGIKMTFSAGPYLAYGVGGKTKFKGNVKIPIIDAEIEDMDFDTFEDDILKPFDFGLGAGVGAEFGSITVGIQYEIGLTNIAKDFKELELFIDKPSYRTRNASLTVGYKF